MPYLIQKRIDGSTVEQWEISDQPLTIGRSEPADVRVKDDRISRQHCVVALKDGKYYVTDLKSTNGTWLNNERITEVELKANDKLRLGQTIIAFMTDRPKGLDTIMGEIEAEGKGLKTYIGELNQPPPPSTPRA
ncbi:MAG: FHA domain-containing protein [Verrucomicrobiota bacterium]